MTVTDQQIDLLLDDLLSQHGYDFTYYSRASLSRRINRLFLLDKFGDFDSFRQHLATQPGYISRFVEEVTVNVTEMFRDSDFYKELAREVIPALGTYPFVRVWLAGCSTGEEAFSVAILLYEAGLLHKTLIYATDINPGVLEKARQGIFHLSQMKQYSENYIAGGGREDFSSYYVANYEGVKFKHELRNRIVFSTHNLVSDGSFNEFHLIVCRNVLIYFDKELQEKVFRLFDASLTQLGFLALGAKETLKFSTIVPRFKQTGKEKIWRKIR